MLALGAIMTGNQLKTYRGKKGLTQLEAAKKLGVSQTYLSLVESGKRPLTERLKRKAAKLFDVPTEQPTNLVAGDLPSVSDDELAADLADLGYMGFGHLRRKRPVRKNPAEVLLTALNARQRDARLVEALPWLLLRFPDMPWAELARAAKMHDLQNRLGYVTDVARQLAEREGDRKKADSLARREAELARSLLAREDTLCNEAMTNAERKWLKTKRPRSAARWHMLTDLSPRHLNYA